MTQASPRAPSEGEPSALLTTLLRDVSRSFYLTLRVLPAPVRSQIGLAYLLARATDTIADTDVVPLPERLSALQILRRRILEGRHVGPVDYRGLAGRQALPAERVLLERAEEAASILDRLEAGDQRRIRDVLGIIIGGQELDLARFGASSSGGAVAALQTDAELDDYTYRVAGCVGEFWTRMCVAHLFTAPADPWAGPGEAAGDGSWFEASGIRFGQGLQLVNILRDLPRDLRQGRCYLPELGLRQVGLRPADLLQPGNEQRLRPLYDRWLKRAGDHLEAGWRYTCAIPRGQVRLRLACAWPVLIGRETLAALRAGPVLDPERRIKVSRTEVRRILTRTVWALPFRGRWRRLFVPVS